MSVRLILSCTNISRVLKPIISRCLCIRISAPTLNEMISILMKIRDKENFYFDYNFADRVAKESGRNLHMCMLTLENASFQQYSIPIKVTAQQKDPNFLPDMYDFT